ncbi:hypothetical protein MMC25_003311 [Agyrium rufum]|nr:hypothetical protein [Agyrium rufum]
MQYRQKILGMERQRTWKAGRPHTFDAKTDAPLLEITPDHQQQYLLASPDSDKAEVRTHSNKRKRDDSVTLGLEFSLRQHELRSAPVPVRTPRIVFHNPYFAHAGTSNEIGHSSLTYNTTIPIALCVNIAPPDCPVILTGQYNLLEADSRSLAKWKGRSLPEYHIPALFRAALYSPIREEPRAWLGYVFTFKQQALTNLRLSAVLRHPKPVAMQVTIVQGVLPGHTGVTDLETDQDVREYVRRMNGSSMIFECTFERL